MLNSNEIKKDFPIFNTKPSIIYLDSTATSLKPMSVINSLNDYYTKYSANIYRGIYNISEKATEEYEKTRILVAEFINAESEKEIVFTRNTTEGLNLLATSFSETIFENDEIVVSIAEHHANFVPWQELCKKRKAKFIVTNLLENAESELSDMNKAKKIINKNTKIVAINYVSNVLGVINDLVKIVKNIKQINPQTLIVIDAAQAIPSFKVDVQKLNIDFLVFSAHKTLGPTGLGILWGKEVLLNKLSPYQFGGEMITEVNLNTSFYKDSPHKFEAGTPAIAEVIAFKESLLYLKQFKYMEILEHEEKLRQLAIFELSKNANIRFLTSRQTKSVGIVSFYHSKIHAHDLAQILAEDNICVRAGHHCAMPLHKHFGVIASVRASFYIYNTEQDVYHLINGIKKAETLFS